MIFFRVLLLLFFLWLGGFVFFLSQIKSEEINPKETADAIIVLTGAKGRIDAGLHLLAQKYGEHLFISGVGQNAALEDLSQYLSSFTTEQVASYKSSITLGHFADSTEGNAIESLAWLKKHGYKKIILVTSNYHMPRSSYLFKYFMPDINITQYQVVGSPNPKLVFLEYHKFLLCLIK